MIGHGLSRYIFWQPRIVGWTDIFPVTTLFYDGIDIFFDNPEL